MELLNNATTAMTRMVAMLSSNSLEIAAGTVGILLLDASMRLWKTEKPRDVLRAASSLFKALAAANVRMSELLVRLASLLDKVVPQRLTDAPPAAPKDGA